MAVEKISQGNHFIKGKRWERIIKAFEDFYMTDFRNSARQT